MPGQGCAASGPNGSAGFLILGRRSATDGLQGLVLTGVFAAAEQRSLAHPHSVAGLLSSRSELAKSGASERAHPLPQLPR